MANRMIPYGYGIRDGNVCVNETEAAVVRKIFSAYIGGANLKSIADSLNESGLTYAAETKWNKNSVARVIENPVYIGAKGYSLLVDEKEFNKANELKRGKGTHKAEYTPEQLFYMDNTYCAVCGKPYRRILKWKTREKWICTGGCKTERYVSDEEYYGGIAKAVAFLKEHPHYGQTELAPAGITQEILRNRNEIARLTDGKQNISFQAVKKLILANAALKFDACSENKGYTYSDFVAEKIAVLSGEDILNFDTLKEIISKVKIGATGEITVEFKNDVSVGENAKEETDANG